MDRKKSKGRRKRIQKREDGEKARIREGRERERRGRRAHLKGEEGR